MASYLRPRRGKEATAKSQNIVLKRGEVFFETPSGGVGTGIGKIKMGDGSTSYASLPYFLKQLDLNDNNTKCAFTNATAATDKSNNTTYLNNIAPSNNLKTLFQNIKQLLLNYNSQLTSLNNDLGDIDRKLNDTIECGTCLQTNDVLFNCQKWKNGLYIIYNTRGSGNVCEFLYKSDSLVAMTNIAPQKHIIDGYNITFQTNSYYCILYARKIG